MVSLALDAPSRRPGRKPRRGLKLLLALIVVAGLGAGGFWLGRRTAPVQAAADAAPAVAEAQAAAAPAAPAGPAGPVAAVPAPGVVAPPPPVAGAPAAAPAAPAANETGEPGLRRVVVRLNGALEGSIAAALPREQRAVATQLTQVVNRLLVWTMQVARDGRPGDQLEILYRTAAPVAPGVPSSAEPVVEALRYASQKLGQTITAYRFQPAGAKWARYYREDGSEVEERLVDGPIKEYEQITSLLRDGRRHAGVDFKTPVGTPVYAPFDGTIVRRNWNWRYNGNSLDIVDPATGRHAIFLHLDVVPKEMAVGRKVKKGEHIAGAGNSGRSYAPHLHYQLEAADGRVLDPFDVHRTARGAIDPGARANFDAERARFDALLAGTVPPAGGGAVQTAAAAK